MANSFLSGLGDMLSQQFSLGENSHNTLNKAADGTTGNYAQLGDFANKFDQSARRQYLEQGYNSNSFTPKQLKIIMQEPDITVLVKKRAFSSLAENFRTDHLNKEENLLLKATKILFQNKCAQISAYEKLSKIEKVAMEYGQIDDALLPVIFSLVDESSAIFGGTFIEGIKSTVDQVRKLLNYSKSTQYTKWMLDGVGNPFKSSVGVGNGVIELTIVTSVSTTSSVDYGQGSCSITITNPYSLMVIKNEDIERAIADAVNPALNFGFTTIGTQTSDDLIVADKQSLNATRAARGASPIDFIVNPNAFLGRRVTAIADSIGEEIKFTYDPTKAFVADGVDIDPSGLLGSSELGKNGLDGKTVNASFGAVSGFIYNNTSEVKLFTTIIKNIYNSLQIKQNSKRQIKNFNTLTNYVRNKLRLYYGNKTIIQPMDVVHIFASSKTKIDNKIIGGLQNSFSGLGILSNINNTVNDLENQFNVLFNPQANDHVDIEKAIFVGNDVPGWLWSILRNQYVGDKSGAHIFAGVVEKAPNGYDGDGKFSLRVTCKDNTAYFEMGQVNFKPAVDVFNGALLDPLTPFNIKFDSVTGKQSNNLQLLDENKALLNSSFLKHKNGQYAGQKVTEKNIIQDAEGDSKTGVKKIMYSPDGFNYRWKEGIGTFVQYDDDVNVIKKESVPAITQDPFFGQDIMNALSLLVTGEPYNFVTFYKAAQKFDTYGTDPLTGQNSSVSFYKNLTSDLAKRNYLWGNFIPFKKITVNDAAFQKMLSGQLTILKENTKIENALQQQAIIQDKLTSLSSAFAKNSSTPDVEVDKLMGQLIEQQTIIDAANSAVVTSLDDPKSILTIIGNDVSIDSDQLLNTDSSNKSITDPGNRRAIRRKINFLTRRLTRKVRANEDVNLFVVDDSYDKDYDIQLLEKGLTSQLSLFNSEYSDVGGKIKSIKDLLNLEFYADTQGNIQVRPPQYNRMPSSVFYKMIRNKQNTGIQIFPQYLEDLFVNHITGLLTKIEIIEDQIRLNCAALGATNDLDVMNLIGYRDFLLMSSTDGHIPGDLTALLNVTDPEKTQDLINNELNPLNDNLNAALAPKRIFDIRKRKALLAQFNAVSISNPLDVSTLTTSYVDAINKRLYIKTGQVTDLKSLFPNTLGNTIGRKEVSQSDIFRILQDISEKVSERQGAIKLAANAVKNIKDSESLDTTSGENGLLFPYLFGQKGIPEIFEHMIEDESYDDFGPGSGKRYVIENSQILSYNIQETPPPYTVIQVNGLFDPFTQAPPDLAIDNIGGSGGNALSTAMAVDYDLWRMYGFKTSQVINAPFLSDPRSQCAPYAVSVLSRARAEILAGTLSIVGNEYQQPGEVIYLEDRDLLFYVTGVSHTFNFGSSGGSFKTDLELKYGHNPGEYIPTYLDIIGKLLYKNRDTSDNVVHRQGSVYNEKPLGAILINGNIGTDGPLTNLDSLITGPEGDYNKKVINDIITTFYSVQTLNDPTVTKPVLELRAYYNSTEGAFSGSQPDTLDKAQTLAGIITGKNKVNDKVLDKNFAITPSDVVIAKAVDIGETGEGRYPSTAAFELAKRSVDNKSSDPNNKLSISQIDNTIYNFIIDCWVVFNNI